MRRQAVIVRPIRLIPMDPRRGQLELRSDRLPRK